MYIQEIPLEFYSMHNVSHLRYYIHFDIRYNPDIYIYIWNCYSCDIGIKSPVVFVLMQRASAYCCKPYEY